MGAALGVRHGARHRLAMGLSTLIDEDVIPRVFLFYIFLFFVRGVCVGEGGEWNFNLHACNIDKGET